ncbi:hypothetical protein AVEN_188449-1 [Araneus ventricosus]|uniref:Uncharacterized protein n=1 Tax=Araneus ventricosus TaxID=182803 RepID=A0A4Y2H8W4_ARAVE|nr:hypothetical protein AVEN_188449-1 [Araneus ventricosus]
MTRTKLKPAHFSLKPRSGGLSFHQFRPLFELFPIVGTGRIDVARLLVSATIVSRFKSCSNGVWLGRSRFVLVDCGRWNSNRGKSLGSARVNRCTDAIWILFPPLMCELFTATKQGTTNTLTNPRATSILPVLTTRNNADRG